MIPFPMQTIVSPIQNKELVSPSGFQNFSGIWSATGLVKMQVAGPCLQSFWFSAPRVEPKDLLFIDIQKKWWNCWSWIYTLKITELNLLSLVQTQRQTLSKLRGILLKGLNKIKDISLLPESSFHHTSMYY